MILGLGLDIVKISRIYDLHSKYGNKFLTRIFTEEEIEKASYFASKDRIISYFAKRFAAKEAFSKAVGDGIGKNISFLDLAILNDANKKPFVKINKQLEAYLKRRFCCDNIVIHLTLSDEIDLASAMVVIEKI